MELFLVLENIEDEILSKAVCVSIEEAAQLVISTKIKDIQQIIDSDHRNVLTYDRNLYIVRIKTGEIFNIDNLVIEQISHNMLTKNQQQSLDSVSRSYHKTTGNKVSLIDFAISSNDNSAKNNASHLPTLTTPLSTLQVPVWQATAYPGLSAVKRSNEILPVASERPNPVTTAIPLSPNNTIL